MGNNIILPFLLILFSLKSFSQNVYAVYFTDKNSTQYSIEEPEHFLSPKSIARRNKQNIQITNEDLPVNKKYIDAILKIGVGYKYTSKWLNLMVVTISTNYEYTIINDLPFVEKIIKLKTVNTVSGESKFGFSNKSLNYGDSEDQIKLMQGDFLHNSTYKGEGMTIAVLDAGFENVDKLSPFASLWKNNQIIGTRDFVKKKSNVFDEHVHGTYVLSSMAVTSEGNLIGTSPNAKYWLIRTENAPEETILEEYNWLAGAEFADSVGVDIINSSLGYTEFDDSTQNHTYSDMNGKTTVISIAATKAANKGILVVNSAGNSGTSGWYYIGAPADAQNILTVGAVNHDGNYVEFSSKGPSFDNRIKPNVAALGRDASVVSGQGEFTTVNGTSLSSPILAGMAACLWQAFPLKTNFEIMDAIEQSASQYKNPDAFKGHGIPNFKKAYFLLSNYVLENENKDQFFNIYPQPFTNQFTVSYYAIKESEIQITLINESGQRLYKKTWSLEKNALNTINLKNIIQDAGTYIVTLKNNSVEMTRKIIKL